MDEKQLLWFRLKQIRRMIYLKYRYWFCKCKIKHHQPPKKHSFSLRLPVKSGEPQIRNNLEGTIWVPMYPTTPTPHSSNLLTGGMFQNPSWELLWRTVSCGSSQITLFQRWVDFSFFTRDCTRRWLKCGLQNEWNRIEQGAIFHGCGIMMLFWRSQGPTQIAFKEIWQYEERGKKYWVVYW